MKHHPFIESLAFTKEKSETAVPMRGTWAAQCDGCGGFLAWDGTTKKATGFLLVDSNPESINAPTFYTKEDCRAAALRFGWKEGPPVSSTPTNSGGVPAPPGFNPSGEKLTCPDCSKSAEVAA